MSHCCDNALLPCSRLKVEFLPIQHFLIDKRLQYNGCWISRGRDFADMITPVMLAFSRFLLTVTSSMCQFQSWINVQDVHDILKWSCPIMLLYKTIMLVRKGLNANVNWCISEADRLSNMLFYLQIWSDVHLDFCCSLSFQLLINQEENMVYCWQVVVSWSVMKGSTS